MQADTAALTNKFNICFMSRLFGTRNLARGYGLQISLQIRA